MARIMRTHGSKPKYFHKVIGGNFRIDPLLAALLAVKLPHLAEYTRRRKENAAYYTESLGRIPGVALTPLPDTAGNCSCGSVCRQTAAGHIVLPFALPHTDHIWNQYTLRIRKAASWKQLPDAGNPRDALQKYLAAREIGSEIYYPKPMHLQECFALPGGRQPEPLPVAEQLAGECLSIPIYPELKREQADTVIDAIRDFIQENAEVG